MLGGELGNFGGAFMLWRGTKMKQEWVIPYYEMVGGNHINIPGNTSCSRDMKVALGFALDKPKQDHEPVLFVFSIHNYFPPLCIAMNNEAFTAYPSEGEVLLTEGTVVRVLAIEKDVLIKNINEGFEAYNNKLITIVHLFNLQTINYQDR